MKHLFLLVPNNSGSSLMHQLIARSPAIAQLPLEGQHVNGWVGPVPRELGVVHMFSLAREFADESLYDWESNVALFDRLWAADNPSASVRLEKSPPNVVRAAMLDEHFESAHYFISWRNPYAAAEGILRNNRSIRPVQAARHVVNMLDTARDNIARYGERAVIASYEEFTENPGEVLARLTELMPELGTYDVDPTEPIQVKGSRYESIRNANDDQIENLAGEQVRSLNRVFRHHRLSLEHFGYELLRPTDVDGDGALRTPNGRTRVRRAGGVKKAGARAGRAGGAKKAGARAGAAKRKGMVKGDFDFRRVGSVDVAAVADGVAGFDDEWTKMTYRQDQYGAHVDTNTIPILWNDPPLFKLLRREDEIGRYHRDQFDPVIDDLREMMLGHFGSGHFLRMILTRLPIGSSIPPHADTGRSFRVSHRVHIPVITAPEVSFRVGSTTQHLSSGEVWEINNFRTHQVRNDSGLNRVHLILDWYCPDGPLGRNLPPDQLVPAGWSAADGEKAEAREVGEQLSPDVSTRT